MRYEQRVCAAALRKVDGLARSNLRIAYIALDKDPVNRRWQEEMSRFFEPVPDLQPGERFAMMKEVFHME